MGAPERQFELSLAFVPRHALIQVVATRQNPIEKGVRAAVFIARCSAAATAAYELASWLALHQAVWAAVSAVIVSQEQLRETRSVLTARILGTLFGIAVTIVVAEAVSRMTSSVAVQMALAIAVCAAVAREFPKMRVAMWTCPIILLTAQPSAPIVVVALRRGSEVILGAAVGWAFHWAAEKFVDRFAAVLPAVANGRGRGAKSGDCDGRASGSRSAVDDQD